MKNFIEKHYKKVIIAVIAFMALVSFLNARNDSAIFDETAHIPAAYSYVTKEEIRLNPEHPPLIKDLAGFPLLFLDLNFNTDNQPFWSGDLKGKWDEGQWAAGKYLLFQAGNNPDRIIFWSRVPIILLSLLLGLFIFKWTKELAGITAGLLALVLYAFDPNILGHNHFVTTDLGIAAFTTFSFYYYLKFLKMPSWKNVALAGLFLGLMQLAKFSSFVAFPIMGLATLLYPLTTQSPTDTADKLIYKLKLTGQYLSKGALAFLFSIIIIWIAYLANTFHMTQETMSQIIDANFSPANTENSLNILANKSLHKLNGNMITRPLTGYGLGMSYVFRRVAGGNGAYFIGQVSSKAFRSYFPTVFALKEPLPTLFLMLSAMILAAIQCVKHCAVLKSAKTYFLDAVNFIRDRITELSLLSFVALYALISITGNLNIGFRHLFPILPFAFILTASTIGKFIERKNEQEKKLFSYLTSIFFLALAIETAGAYPYYMSYFNQIAGGPKNGYRYVTDSNADWGQDLKRLKTWIEKYNRCPAIEGIKLGNNPTKCMLHEKYGPIGKIRVNYFGGADVKYYLGDIYEDWWDSKRPIAPGWYAISTNYLMGSIHDTTKKDSDSYRWIVRNNIKPVAQVGTAIFVYYITDDQAKEINK